MKFLTVQNIYVLSLYYLYHPKHVQELHRSAGGPWRQAVQHPELHDDVHLRLDHEHRVQDQALQQLAYGGSSTSLKDL